MLPATRSVLPRRRLATLALPAELGDYSTASRQRLPSSEHTLKMRCRWFGAAVLAATVTAHASQSPGASAPAAISPPIPTPSPITDHFALDGIFFYGHVATTGTFNSSSGTPGTPFSAENDLGLSDKAVQPRVELMVRMAQRSRLRLNFFDLPRSGNAVVAKTIQFGNQTYFPGERLHSEVDWRQTDFTYTYSFLHNDRFELGAGLALHLIQTEATAQSPDTPQRSDYSAAGPFATIALDGSVRITRRWSFNARGQYFHISVSSGSGSLGQYHADVQFRWLPNFSLGAGYESEQVDLQAHHANSNQLNGTVHLNINAPELFVRLSL